MDLTSSDSTISHSMSSLGFLIGGVKFLCLITVWLNSDVVHREEDDSCVTSDPLSQASRGSVYSAGVQRRRDRIQRRRSVLQCC